MGLEAATFICQFVTTNPAGADDRSTSDDHHRLIKTVLQNSFPNINGAVTASLAEINKLDGLTASQAELNLLTNRSLASTGLVIDNFPTGTLMLFQQTAAPAGWTKVTTQNNKALRVVSGTAGTGGTSTFSTVFGQSETSGHALTTAELPAHDHGSEGTHGHNIRMWSGAQTGNDNAAIGEVDSGYDGLVEDGNITERSGVLVNNGAHTHDSVGSDAEHVHAMDLRVQYVDIILASKD